MRHRGFVGMLHGWPDAVVFEMDGVLFDTEPLSEEAALGACAKLGYVMPPGSIAQDR